MFSSSRRKRGSSIAIMLYGVQFYIRLFDVYLFTFVTRFKKTKFLSIYFIVFGSFVCFYFWQKGKKVYANARI